MLNDSDKKRKKGAERKKKKKKTTRGESEGVRPRCELYTDVWFCYDCAGKSQKTSENKVRHHPKMDQRLMSGV